MEYPVARLLVPAGFSVANDRDICMLRVLSTDGKGERLFQEKV